MKRDIIVDRCKFTNVNRNRYTYAEIKRDT